jgi:probable F420-dependent oxidoreductase
MRISVSLPRPGGRPDGHVAACAELASAAELAGAHAVSATDHPFPLINELGVGHQAHDPFTLLGFLAARTTKIRLQVSLLVAGYRNPFLAARMVSTLDQVSQGRAMLTLGSGYQQAEFAALGSRFADRGRLLREAVPAMRAAWTGSPVRSSGNAWSADGNSLSPRCVQLPHPPLWRGGNSAAAVAHVATELDGWAPLEVSDRFASKVRTTGLTMETLPEAVAALHDQWRQHERSGRPEVAFVRTRTDWLADVTRVVSDVSALQRAGVTWVELTPAGDTVDAQTDSVQRTLAGLDGAGLLEAV